jgi:hypothetical protein
MKLKSRAISIFLLLSLFTLPGLYNCGVYTFTGTTIAAETLSIQNFFNDADGGPPDLSQNFSDQLRDYFQTNTNLTLVQVNGELTMEGSVVGYRLSPLAPTSSNDPDRGDAAALTRLTITVKVAYVNTLDPEFDFDKNFSFYADYDSDLDLTNVEETLIDEIFEQIILDIFNASVANW